MVSKNLIAVVDGNIDIHDLISAFLRPKGFLVSCFESAEGAIGEAAKSGCNWDVVLVGDHFAEITRLEFSLKIKKTLPKLPVIYIPLNDNNECSLNVAENINYTQLLNLLVRELELKRQEPPIDLPEKNKNQSTLFHDKIIGRSPKFVAALEVAKRVAGSHASIFISGESGTGKEVFAKLIHSSGEQRNGPFVAINCSAIPEALLESELFGHAKGAFTGAHINKVGMFEEAEDGTLFLDEIGDLSLPLQAKLLRVLQEKKIKRVGENQYREINCRVISATHKNLAEEVKENRFREDLYFRLNVIPIFIPPLRERKEDILLLAEAFLKKYANENHSCAKTFSKDAIKYILENPWRGNVRELENTVERAAVLCDRSEVSLENILPSSLGLGVSASVSRIESSSNEFKIHCTDHLPLLDEVIKSYIEFAVIHNGGARDRTAREIGIDRKTLYKKIRFMI
jgi:two-component system, NtrC family, response regulator HydG